MATFLGPKHPEEVQRSSRWSTVRKAFLLKNPTCAACGGRTKLEVHHIIPFHIDPSKELDEANLIVLCESDDGGVLCHLHFGHLGSYKAYNPDVIEDARIWKEKIDNRPFVIY
jgi:5-methylcytosine-specific restriction enzyme A